MLSLFKLITLLLVQSAFSIPAPVTHDVKTKYGIYQGEAVPGYTNIADWKVNNTLLT